jgi:hypothetical protein
MSVDTKRWLVGVVLALLLQAATLVFYLGRMSERVDGVQRTTETLLRLQLEKSAAAR